MTRPLRSTPITGLHHYYEPVRQPDPQRYSHPRNARATPSRPPGNPNGQCRIRPSPFPCRSRRPGSRRLHAGHRLANQRAPARLIPGSFPHPGFDVTCIYFDTSTANRLRSPSRSSPDTSRVPFPHRSPRSRHRFRSMWWFEASPRRATPKGQQSFISCTAPLQQALPTSNSLPRQGHTGTEILTGVVG
jgi:hypothetical protein